MTTTETRILSNDVVEITVFGKMTDCYVITDPMGSSKKGPLERWFEIRRCESVKQVGPREFKLTLTRDYLAKRGITHADLNITRAASPTHADDTPAQDAPQEVQEQPAA